METTRNAGTDALGVEGMAEADLTESVIGAGRAERGAVLTEKQVLRGTGQEGSHRAQTRGIILRNGQSGTGKTGIRVEALLASRRASLADLILIEEPNPTDTLIQCHIENSVQIAHAFSANLP